MMSAVENNEPDETVLSVVAMAASSAVVSGSSTVVDVSVLEG